jgi:RNA polymerase sigma-70 factor, ECF subfamily
LSRKSGLLDFGIENNLTSALKQGDTTAFAYLYEHYSDMLYGIILRIVADREDSNNLLQDCFVKVWCHIAAYDAAKGRLSTWLINIARNTAIDFTRSKAFAQRQRNQSLDFSVSKIAQIPVSGLNIDTIGLASLVQSISAASRQIIEWMYFEGLTQQEIADQHQIPLGTVKTRTRSALKELRQFFDLESE